MTGRVGRIAGASRVLAVLGSLVSGALMPIGVEADGNFNADGYRQNNYRVPTPDSVPGGTVLDLDQLKRLMATDHPVMIDVLSAGDVEPDPFDGSWAVEQSHDHIPGSVWLPNVGRGYLDDVLESFFEVELARLTDNDPGRPVVFYCLRDCWMGWNATRRAARWGYTRVFWYPAGVDEWREAGEPLRAATPVAVTVTE